MCKRKANQTTTYKRSNKKKAEHLLNQKIPAPPKKQKHTAKQNNNNPNPNPKQ
jgi:hypothetical protein